MNSITILVDDAGAKEVFLNGNKLEQVVDFGYNKTSADQSTEVYVKFVVDELEEKVVITE